MARTLSDRVKARIAEAVLGRPLRSPDVGGFVLREAQREAVRRIEHAIARYGGALLADPPGTGKTAVALAVAAAYPQALVFAPATLRAQWLGAAERAGLRIAFHSLESLSRGAQPPDAALVIVDEAHHVRSPSTVRYRRLAEHSAGRPLLLLSATPVVNRRADRDALLALFLGERARSLPASALATVVIRRESPEAMRPTVVELPPLDVALPPLPIAERLRRLPAPLPTSDGSEALALVRLSLAMAWASSLAALDAALRRRVQRGESLAASLEAGRWPDRAALRQWVVGDDATQLAMPLLLADLGAAPPAAAGETLHAHLEAVRALRALVQPAVEADAARRASALRALAARTGRARLVVFCSHASTIRALFRALRGTPGVLAITGTGVLAAQGRWSRAEVLATLGPQAAPWRPDDPRGIRLLLTTDLLAEGVEMQGAGVVVHGDVAWTPARFEQRVGRAARLGRSDDVLVTRFPLPDGAQAILDLQARLRRKERARVQAVAAPRIDAATREAIARWRAPDVVRGARAQGAVRGAANGFLALLRSGSAFQLLGGRLRGSAWRVVDAPEEIAALVAAVGGEDLPLDSRELRRIRRALHHWCGRASGANAVGLSHGVDRGIRRAVRRRLDAALRGTPHALRATAATRWGDALNRTLATPGAGTAQAFARLLRSRPDPSAFAAALEALATSRLPGQAPGPPRTGHRPRLAALLRIVADEVD